MTTGNGSDGNKRAGGQRNPRFRKHKKKPDDKYIKILISLPPALGRFVRKERKTHRIGQSLLMQECLNRSGKEVVAMILARRGNPEIMS